MLAALSRYARSLVHHVGLAQKANASIRQLTDRPRYDEGLGVPAVWQARQAMGYHSHSIVAGGLELMS